MDEQQNSVEAEKWRPSPDLLDQLVADLGHEDSANVEVIKQALSDHVYAFGTTRRVVSSSPTIHEDVNRAKRIAGLSKELLAEIDAMSPMTYFPFHQALSELDGPNIEPKNYRATLDGISEVANRLAQSKFAKRQKNHALDNAVGGLMLLLENLTGNRATVQKARSDFALPPTLNSKEARAIASLLRVVDPKIADTTFVNLILKIRAEHRGKALSSYSYQRLIGMPVTAV